MTLDDIRGRATITVDETASVLDMGLRQTYAAIRDGSLPSLRLLRRILVPVPALLCLLGDIEGEDG